MGGTIEVDSIEGEGSCFHFQVPFAIAKKKVEENQITHSRDLKKAKILLAEDNEMNVLVATAYLEKWNAQYDVAETGKQACELLSQNHYDLVLMDLHMPVMDGYEASQAIRAFEENDKKSIPIIALTASALMEIRERIQEAGMSAFVSKPFEPDELYQTIEKHLPSLHN